MPIEKPTYQNIVDRIRASIVSYLPEVDPTIYGSIIRSLGDSLAGRSFDMVQLFTQLEKNLFPDSAEGEFLERWGTYQGLLRKPATISQGYINVIGLADAVIPVDTRFNSRSGNNYIVKSEAILADQVIGVTALSESGGVATAVTDGNHGYGTGLTVTIAGAVQPEYNGDFVITALSEISFSYTVTPGLPVATGTITSTFTGNFVFVESELFEGEADAQGTVNLGNSSQLTLTSPIAGVESTAFVSFLGIQGGVLQENDVDFRARILRSRQNPVANFNVGRIEKTVLGITGVTRVKVKRITPYIGAVTVLFVRDYDDNIIPTPEEVTEVKNAILEYLPANSDEVDVFVKAPIPHFVNFTFSTLVPSTDTMKQAIRDNLQAFFQDELGFESPIGENIYNSVIASTIDTETGDRVESFELFEPVGEVPIGEDGIGLLGDILFL